MNILVYRPSYTIELAMIQNSDILKILYSSGGLHCMFRFVTIVFYFTHTSISNKKLVNLIANQKATTF